MYPGKKTAVLFSVFSLMAVLTACETTGKTPISEQVEVTDKSFLCLHQMTRVRNMYVDNIAGNLEGTLAVAKSAAGGVYPPGTVLQVFPGEAMVKLNKGAHPQTNDWEFFDLAVSPQGAKIKQRGFETVKNMFGTCVSCHQQAAPQWDMVCEKTHGCQPIVFPGGIDTATITSALQKTDPRCSSPEPPTPDEMAALKKLQEIMAAQAAAGVHTGTPQ